MDFISIEKGENLFWLGRYVERVYRTLNYLEGLYDVLIDTDETAYKEFCVALNIPDVYEDASDFMTSYFFDELNPDSVYSNPFSSLRRRNFAAEYHLDSLFGLYSAGT